MPKPLTYDEVYRSLNGMAALAVAGQTFMGKEKDERDTAFVKRIVAHYIVESQSRSD